MSVSNPPEGEPMDIEAGLYRTAWLDGLDNNKNMEGWKTDLHRWHNQQAYKEVLELIGPNEQGWGSYDMQRNSVRDTLRQAVKQRYEQ